MIIYKVDVNHHPLTTYFVLADTVEEAIGYIQKDWFIELEAEDYEIQEWSDLTSPGIFYDSTKGE